MRGGDHLSLPKINRNLPKPEEKERKMPVLGEMPSLDEWDNIEPVEDEEEYEIIEEEEYLEEELLEEAEKSYDDSKISDPMIYDDEHEEEYIDYKERKVKPMGGKKSKRIIKAGDFDERKNTMVVAKVIRTVTLSVLVILFGLGIKNTFSPANNFSRAEIQNIARNAVGSYGFPNERGRSFAEDFMQEFLTVDKGDPSRAHGLSYYYTGSYDSSSINTDRMKLGQKTTQKILVQPRVYEMTPITEYSTLYKVSAYVTDTTGLLADGTQRAGRWVAFAINVYYDELTDTLAITPDSPTLIPRYEVATQSNVPQIEALGNGDTNREMLEVLTPTIDGYVHAYASASLSSHNEIMQYIPKDSLPELYSGFGGSVEVRGRNSNNIQKVIFNTDNPDEYKVAVTVEWMDTASTQEDNAITYNSDYVMTISATADGKFLVTGFKPYYYIKGN